MAKQSDAAKKPQVVKKQHDEDLAIKPINPMVDHALGFVFVALCLRLLYEFTTDWDLGLLFTGCLVGVMICIRATTMAATFFGRKLSEFRDTDSIPPSCRNPLKSKLAMRKFSDQAWQLLIHASMTVCEVFLLHGQPWWDNPASAFDPCPSTFRAGTNAHPFVLKGFYVLQLAIWIWTGYSCKWIESRRKDYLEMMLHHCFTIMLVLFSLLASELPIGLLILFIHDASDVVLDMMKMANYLKVEDAHGFFMTEILFVLNLVTWVYFRLYRFPIFVVYGGVWLGYSSQCGVPEAVGTLAKCYTAGTCLTSCVLLSALCCLHVFWFYLILRIAARLLSGKNANDAAKAEYEGNSGADASDKND